MHLKLILREITLILKNTNNPHYPKSPILEDFIQANNNNI